MKTGNRLLRAATSPASLVGALLLILSLLSGSLVALTPDAAAQVPSRKIAFASNRDGNWEIYVMNADGSCQVRLTNNPADDLYPTWSPDGGKIAFASNRDGNVEIYVMNADGSGQTNLTKFSGGLDHDWLPAWSPDGRKIAFNTNRNGTWEIYVMNPDGSNQTRPTNYPVSGLGPAWSPDGRKIAFSTDRDGNWEIYVTDADGSNQTRLTHDPIIDWITLSPADTRPTWSPDGGKIAFTTNRHEPLPSNWEIYVMNADGTGQTRLTNNPDNPPYWSIDAEPAWSPDGDKIAFVSTREGPYQIYIMNPDGSNVTRLTNNDAADWRPVWGPKDTTPPTITIDTPQPFAVLPVGTALTFAATDLSCVQSVIGHLNDGTTTMDVNSGFMPVPGVYTLTVEAVDFAANTASESRFLVIYDPAAGFATGGGWFVPGGPTSDAGDLLPGLDSTSPAQFGFVVKYKPGATTPAGQMEFQYRQGSFNLHSSGMDWLVVVNNNWAKFQGKATIKGLTGEFPFRVDARDGDYGGGTQPDRFIIKVWASGANPDLDEPIYKASGDLKGGSIVIHTK